MENLPTEDASRFDSLIENFAFIKEKHRDNYPIILYEPSIHCQENKYLKKLAQGSNSIHLFDNFKEAFKFTQSLNIGFILIVSKDLATEIVLKNFKGLSCLYGREGFDFEEETLLKDAFPEISDDLIKSLNLKVYFFNSLLDFGKEAEINKEEEEVMVMCDIKEMTKEFRQEFTVIFFDPNGNSVSKHQLEKDIEIRIEERNVFLDFGELYRKIKNYTGIPYHLIFSGRDQLERIIKEIDDYKDLLGLYIYDDNQQKIDNDKVEMQKTLKELIPKIKEGFRTKSKLTNTFPAFATNFDARDKSNIYNMHYYLKGLINFKNRKQAKGDFLKLARNIYQDQDRLLVRFDNEYEEFNNERILHWYTRDSPVYKLLNNRLRIASSDSILYSRFVLKDMEEAIREQYQKKGKDFNGAVYRGAYISADEWDKLGNNVGEEIEMSCQQL